MGSCSRIVHHSAGHPLERVKMANVWFPPKCFSGLPRLTEEIWPPPYQPKGSRFLTRHHQFQGRTCSQDGTLLTEDGGFSSLEIIRHAFSPYSPGFLLYIYFCANKQQCHLETTSRALLKTAAQGFCRTTAATGACNS